VNKGDLVTKISAEGIGIIVALGPEQAAVFWGDGVISEGPLADLEPVPYYPDAGFTANFGEMVNQVYPDHIAWLREGSPGSGRAA
jgi:hypothetical protein